jgi:hypothetical protein
VDGGKEVNVVDTHGREGSVVSGVKRVDADALGSLPDVC